jgi:hypothetical protein
MQVNPLYPRHRFSKDSQVGVEKNKQREAAVTLALALRQQFSVNGEVLKQVEVFKYLGRLLAQDNDDIQAIRIQLQKACATWAWTGPLKEECLTTCHRHFLQGDSTGHPPVWQQNLGSPPDSFGMS